MESKRGLSTIITTLILILLALVAIGIIWVVIQNILTKGSEQISLGKFTLNLEIEKILVNPGLIDVTVKRNQGKGELSGIRFLISDGTNTEIIEEKNIELDELGSKTFSLKYNGLVKKVSIAPIMSQESGTESVGDVKDNLELSSEKTIQNIPGLVSWWRLDGNVDDKMNLNPGIVNTATPTTGKYNQGYAFNGDDDYINCGNNPSSDITGYNITIAAWIKLSANATIMTSSVGDGGERILSKDDLDFGYFLAVGYPGNQIVFGVNGIGNEIISNNNQNINQWYHVVGTNNNTDTSIYINGVLDHSQNSNPITSSAVPLKIGVGYFMSGFSDYFNGTIDEVMIFNRSLSQQEIQGIYNLDLSS